MRTLNTNTNARMNTIANTNTAATVNVDRNTREGVFEGVNSGATVSGGRFFCPPLTSQVCTAMSVDMRTALSRFLAERFCTLKPRLKPEPSPSPGGLRLKARA